MAEDTYEQFVADVTGLLARAPRLGRPDGSSVKGDFVARWTDEDTGPHEARLSADSEQEVRDALEPYIGTNTLTIRRIEGRVGT